MPSCRACLLSDLHHLHPPVQELNHSGAEQLTQVRSVGDGGFDPGALTLELQQKAAQKMP